ncbi:hypothetical protein R4036_004573 [Salmonella enterica]|nr:hypothetical protein [Salmonella enterica]
MAIKIPVSVQFDSAGLKDQIRMINDQVRILASQVGQAKNQTYNPINVKSTEDVTALRKEMEKLLKIQTELSGKMKSTGQGSNPLMADWNKLYGDKDQRIQKMQSMLQFLGVEFTPQGNPKPPKVPAPAPTPAPTTRPAPAVPGWQQALRQFGPQVAGAAFGSVPGGSSIMTGISTGMSLGAGAGVVAAGLLALKEAVQVAVQQIGKAQQLEIQLDNTYRAAGGSLNYNALKLLRNTNGVANGLTPEESQRALASYVSTGGLRAGTAGLEIGAGFGRSLGIDPAQTAAIFGSLGGSRIARNNDDYRRIGEALGEGLAKSGSWGEYSKTLSAAAQYMSQTAAVTHNTPNLAAYLATSAGLTNSGLPGTDSGSVAALLNRANQALMQGGGFGQAGQNFIARTHARLGVRGAFASRVLSEGGAFGTMSQQLGAGSTYARFMGHSGGEGDTPMMIEALNAIRQEYRGNRGYQAQAAANLMNISEGDAMALLMMRPQTLNGVSTRLNRLGIKNVNPTSYATLGQIESGQNLATLGSQYMQSSNVNANDKSRLDAALRGSNPEELKDVLATIASKAGAEETEGEKTRSSLAKIETAITDFSGKAVPPLNTMMQALLKASGMTPDELRADYAQRVTKDNMSKAGAYWRNQQNRIQAEMFGTDNTPAGAAKRRDLEAQMQAAKTNEQLEKARIQVQGAAMAGDLTGGDITNKNTGNDYSGSPSAAAAAAGSGSDYVTGHGRLGMNNPGNTTKTNGEFIDYLTMRQGVEGAAGRWLRYRSGASRQAINGRDHASLLDLASIYAPKGDGKNDPVKYATYLKNKLGVKSINDTIDLRAPGVLEKLTAASITFEGNKVDPKDLTAGVKDALSNKQNYTPNYPQQVQHEITVNLNHPDGHKQVVKTQYVQPLSFSQRPTAGQR